MVDEIYDGGLEGLKEAAKELNDSRERGEPISAPEPPPREDQSEAPAPDLVRVDAEAAGRWNEEKDPYIRFSEKPFGSLTERQAAEVLIEKRGGDEVLRQMMEQSPEDQAERLREQ
ncbi:MAG: hypothetical protein ACRECI_05420, partial [Methyloceanibacter sp.]